jgi:hypothetical protein
MGRLAGPTIGVTPIHSRTDLAAKLAPPPVPSYESPWGFGSGCLVVLGTILGPIFLIGGLGLVSSAATAAARSGGNALLFFGVVGLVAALLVVWSRAAIAKRRQQQVREGRQRAAEMRTVWEKLY